MNTNLETLTSEENKVPVNTISDDAFVDVFFDEEYDENNAPVEELNDIKNIIKPADIKQIHDEGNPFIETPIVGGMVDEVIGEPSNQETVEDIKATDEIGAPIVETIKENKKNKQINEEVVSFDEFFSNLSENVVGANKYISEVMDVKRVTDVKQSELKALKEKLENQEKDFRNFLDKQNKILETSKKQLDDYIQSEKLRLESEIAQFKTETDAVRSELMLSEENLKMKQHQLDNEKEQFEKHVKTESEIIADGHNKLNSEKEQFSKEKLLTQESFNNANKEIKIKQDEFKQYKEFEERKLDLESQNLAKSCARFKQIVSQLNSGFSQLKPTE
ncbi:MAG: hypothetical protein RR847_03825 [Bacilli bacterium]